MENKPQAGTEGGACPICKVQATKWCSRCNSVYYCSVDHQTQHWSDHKVECKEIQSANKSKAPKTQTPAQKNARIPRAVGTTFTVDAILFPVDEDVPRIVQMGFEVKSAEDGGNGLTDTWHLYDMSYFERLLGDKMIGRSAVYHKQPGGELIPGGCTLELVYRDNYANDGSRVNQCIQRLTGGNTLHSFRGNFLALRRPGSEETGIQSDLVVNIEDGDLEYLKNYFIGYGRTQRSPPEWLSKFGGAQVLQL